MSELVTLIGDEVVGTLTQARGRLSFTYADRWRARAGAHPLSLSMPLTSARHGHATVDTFLWGLLPDNARVLDRWGMQFHVSPRNAFALLQHVGEDCAGAVRFATPERAASLTRDGDGAVRWLSEREIGQRLRALRDDVTAWRRFEDAGQFSLAGAQPKTALFFDGKRWGVPSGRIPTTHILKPGTPSLDGHAENEHFCLALAAELGLPVATSRITRFDGETAIVVERYDRIRTAAGVVRVHQEDMCQALGVHPDKKYESDGGPGVKEVVRLLREEARVPPEDVATFVSAVALSWLVAATDGHAKNYSLLIGASGRARLAPLYDVASILPYTRLELWKTKLAMKVGGTYRLREIGPLQWRKLASELKLDEEMIVAMVRDLADRIPDLATMLRRRLRAQRVTHPVTTELAERLAARARSCSSALR